MPKGCQTAARGHKRSHWSARGSAWCWTQIHSLSGLETVRIRSADPELVCADFHLGAAPPSEACGAGLLGSMAILFELSLSFFSFGGPVVSNCQIAGGRSLLALPALVSMVTTKQTSPPRQGAMASVNAGGDGDLESTDSSSWVDPRDDDDYVCENACFLISKHS